LVPEDQRSPGKNRVHLDITVRDLDTEVRRLRTLGATEVVRHDHAGRWATMRDPSGLVFDLVQA
jgi:predicted enzyme related to lactoylglutathione lyase